MRAARKVLLRDFLTGLGGLFAFGYYLPPGFGLVEGVLAFASAVAFGSLQFLSEHRVFPAWAYDVRDDLLEHPHRLVGITIITVVVALAPLALFPPVLDLYYGVFVGSFLGMLGYRFVFGVVLPVPQVARNRV